MSHEVHTFKITTPPTNIDPATEGRKMRFTLPAVPHKAVAEVSKIGNL